MGASVRRLGSMKTYGEPFGRSRGIMKPVPMSLVAAGRREALLGAAGRSLPPQLQRFQAWKKTVGAAPCPRRPVIGLQNSRRMVGGRELSRARWIVS